MIILSCILYYPNILYLPTKKGRLSIATCSSTRGWSTQWLLVSSSSHGVYLELLGVLDIHEPCNIMLFYMYISYTYIYIITYIIYIYIHISYMYTLKREREIYIYIYIYTYSIIYIYIYIHYIIICAWLCVCCYKQFIPDCRDCSSTLDACLSQKHFWHPLAPERQCAIWEFSPTHHQQSHQIPCVAKCAEFRGGQEGGTSATRHEFSVRLWQATTGT